MQHIPIGYAWSGGGKRIVRVDVTSDQGKTWHVADLEQINEKNSRHWSWTLWTILLPVPEGEETVFKPKHLVKN